MPHKGKTNKSLMKRVKVTGRGRLVKRKPDQNHFNARESGNSIRSKRGTKDVPKGLMKDAQQLLQSNF